MDQFSHDLTLALEETSLMDRACGVGRWGSRRRTRSTGNLPCAPQPTEDSSSSPTDTALHAHAGHGNQAPSNMDGLDTVHMQNALLPASDSDDKAEAMLPLRLHAAKVAVRMGLGALESDSLNETTFSPARFYKPNSRRKRKIKRMSMEFEFSKDSNFTSESPLHPGMLSGCLYGVAGTASGTLRKRLLKATTAQSAGGGSAAAAAVATTTATATATMENNAGNRNSNLFFCGKRKRSNRDRYHEHDHGHVGQLAVCIASSKLHSSSVPRYTHMDEYHRMRPRSYSSTSKPISDRLLPLNKGLLSKINRMAQQQQHQQQQQTQKTDNTTTTATTNMEEEESSKPQKQHQQQQLQQQQQQFEPLTAGSQSALAIDFSMETLVPVSDIESLLKTNKTAEKLPQLQPQPPMCLERKKSSHSRRRRGFCQTPQLPQLHIHQSKMDCGELYDFFSSSSLSSSSSSDDSEDDLRRHDTAGEGDDELTDWPGNELGGKYDPKRKLTKKSLLPQIRSDDTIGEDDTLMSGTEMMTTLTTTATTTTIDGCCLASNTNTVSQVTPPLALDVRQDLSRFQPAASSKPIEICGGGGNHRGGGFIDASHNDQRHAFDMDSSSCVAGMPPASKQIESEMSGETSNPFLSSSPPVQVQEVREIRAGCRRINGDRPGFSIKLSVNERLARFLQDPRQTQIRLPDIEIFEQDSLLNLATLYSLHMVVEHSCTVLTKTRNTTQSVNIDTQRSLQERQDLFGDLKRRCYGDAPLATSVGGAATTATAADTAATELLAKK